MLQINIMESGGDIDILVIDDGKGIDKEKIKQVCINKNLMGKKEINERTNGHPWEIL